MRLAAVVDESTQTVTRLPDGQQILIYNTLTNEIESFDNPAIGRAKKRRAAVVEFLKAQKVDIVCSVPEAFCPISHENAKEAGIRFIQLPPGTKFTDVTRNWKEYQDRIVTSLCDSDLTQPGT